MRVFLLALGIFSILNTEMGMVGLLPFVTRSFSVTIGEAGLLVSLFALAVALSGPVLPLLFSRFVRKRVMLFVLALFTVTSAAAAFATDFYVLLALRVLPAFFHPVYCAMAFSVAAEEGGARAIAKVNVGVAGGMVAGVPLANFLAGTFSLSTALLFFAIVTAVVFFGSLFLMKDEPARDVPRVPILGAARRALTAKGVCAICAVVLLNGSIFGTFNYIAEYLASAASLAPGIVSTLLLAYGLETFSAASHQACAFRSPS